MDGIWIPAEQRVVGTRGAVTGQSVRDGGIVPSIAVGPDGMLWVAWQNACFTAGVRNAIAVYRAHDGATCAETRAGNTSSDTGQAPLTGGI